MSTFSFGAAQRAALASACVTLLASAHARAAGTDDGHGFYASAAAIAAIGAGPASRYDRAPGFASGGVDIAVGHDVGGNVALALDAAASVGSTVTRPSEIVDLRALALVDWLVHPRFDLRFGAGVTAFEVQGHTTSNSLSPPPPSWEFARGVGPTLLVGAGMMFPAEPRTLRFTLGLDLSAARVWRDGEAFTPLQSTGRVGVVWY